MDAPRPQSNGRKMERVAVFSLCMAIGWFYLWTVRSTGEPWDFGHEQRDYYNRLIDGYLVGQLHMKTAVPEALLKLENPYDPAQRPPGVGLHDASLYRGKYYVYFGAAPMVLLMLPFRVITGMDMPLAVAVLVFVYLGFLASTVVFLAIRRRYFPTAGLGVVLWGVLALGLASATPGLLRRPEMWELPIAGGYCFAMLALGALWQSLHAARGRARWWASAGLCLGLAIASRPTYLFAGGLLAAPLVWWWWQARRVPWRLLLAATLPLAAIGAAMAWHNWARFGDPLQFGQAYQLSFDYESKLPHFATRYVPFTFYAHFFGPAEWTRYFPFISRGDLGVAPEGFTVHRGDIYGLLTHFPIMWLALLAPLALWRRNADERGPLGAWLTAAALLFAGTGGVMLLFFSALARYQVEFVPAFLLLAGVGLLALDRGLSLAARGLWRRWIMMAVGAVAVASAAFGVVFSLQFDGLLAHHNPRLAHRLAQLFNRAPALVERMLGVNYGPIELRVRVPVGAPKGDEVIARIGRRSQEDRVILRNTGDGRVQFGLAPADAPERFGRPLVLTADAVHRVSVSLASLFPPATHPFFAGRTPAEIRAMLRRAEIAVDGEVVLREHLRLERASFGEVRVGRVESWSRVANPFPAAVSALRADFRGNDLTGPGDTLRLRVVLPVSRPAGREPLVVTGRSGAGDLLMIEYLGGDEVRFSLDHWGSPLAVSPTVRLASDRSHEFEISFASLAAVEDATLMEAEQPGGMRLTVDGVKLWDEKMYFFTAEAAEVWIGRNTIGGTGCAPEFTGEVQSAQRVVRE
ncbi:MAG: hypothetical protein ABIQ12_03990 [Opitutaceae bacterium]